ncbi:MAG: BamA/TamA family outer membrane protein, partial [Deltaproteobacteria bacterium]|nr:BamA/TamA family outer membrane protein [Deltaproteobacteria bacterium]
MKRLLFILLGLLVTLPLLAGSVRIAGIQIEGKDSLPREQILNLLTLKEGELFDGKRLDQSIEYLNRWGPFSEITVEKKPTPRGVLLVFHLKEGMKIVDLHISGNYPYLSRALHRKLSVRRGDFYRPEVAENQVERLKDFYEREGYFGTEVTLEVAPDKQGENVVLRYRISKGKRYRFDRIEVEGNQLFPHGYFNSRINPLRLYRPSGLRKSLGKIRKDYRDNGYLQARVRIAELLINHERHKINLKLAVQEGPRVTVLFFGNRRISRKNLKKIIPILTEGDTSSPAIEESLDAIRALYKERGFLEASVRSKKTRLDPSRIAIRFDIKEGIQTRVKKIEFVGEKGLHPRKIKPYLETEEESLLRDGFYIPETVSTDFQKLPAIYHRKGFLDAKALDSGTRFSPLRDKVTVSFAVEEGPPSRIGSVRFAGNRLPESKLLRRLSLKEGDTYSQEKLLTDQKGLISHYSDQGYAYATVEPEIQRGGQKVDLLYKIEEGPMTVVGEIVIVGNYRTRPSAIKKALDLKPGRPFSLARLLKSESSLRRMGVFRSVDMEPLGINEREEVIHLLVKVEENPRSFIDLEASYDTDNKFTGATSFQHNNLFGFAKRSTLRLTGGNDIQKGELNYIDPRFFGFSLEMIAAGLVEAEQRPSFEAIDAGGRVSFRTVLTDQMTVLTRYELIHTSFQDVADPTALITRDHTTSRVGLSFNYDSRDSFADPKKGFNTLTGIDFSNKLLGSGIDFIQPQASV